MRQGNQGEGATPCHLGDARRAGRGHRRRQRLVGVPLVHRGGHPAEDGQAPGSREGELAREIAASPREPRKSPRSKLALADQGVEIAAHADFTAATGFKVYFCAPTRPGRRAPTRTPTASSGFTSRRAPSSRTSPTRRCAGSRRSSTRCPARRSASGLPPRRWRSYYQ